jgi:hypothetical protein
VQRRVEHGERTLGRLGRERVLEHEQHRGDPRPVGAAELGLLGPVQHHPGARHEGGARIIGITEPEALRGTATCRRSGSRFPRTTTDPGGGPGGVQMPRARDAVVAVATPPRRTARTTSVGAPGRTKCPLRTSETTRWSTARRICRGDLPRRRSSDVVQNTLTGAWSGLGARCASFGPGEEGIAACALPDRAGPAGGRAAIRASFRNVDQECGTASGRIRPWGPEHRT